MRYRHMVTYHMDFHYTASKMVETANIAVKSFIRHQKAGEVTCLTRFGWSSFSFFGCGFSDFFGKGFWCFIVDVFLIDRLVFCAEFWILRTECMLWFGLEYFDLEIYLKKRIRKRKLFLKKLMNYSKFIFWNFDISFLICPDYYNVYHMFLTGNFVLNVIK